MAYPLTSLKTLTFIVDSRENDSDHKMSATQSFLSDYTVLYGFK